MMREDIAPVLYVEDEADDVYFMRRAFKRAGVKRPLLAVNDGGAAIDYLAGTGAYCDRARYPMPALILLDINLPLRSGFEVLAWIRTDARLRDVAVVMFSSSGRPEDRARAIELGATKYLLKPTSGGDFTEVVHALGDCWLATR